MIDFIEHNAALALAGTFLGVLVMLCIVQKISEEMSKK